MSALFDYDEAFSRNLGWVTPGEQDRLRAARIAVAGLGGVGGLHALTLARLGIGRFHLGDFDRFDLVNFNRQAGATTVTLGRPKVDVLAEMVSGINPDAEIVKFPEGVDATNVERFLGGVDVFVDGLDFFAFATRELVFAACHSAGIPAITVAPLGMGAALLNFVPGGMSFADYFGFAQCRESDLPLRFLIGLAPALLQRRYLADISLVDFERRRGPSTAMACHICAGIAATEVLKILLQRGKVAAAPHGVQFDAYRNKLVRTWRPGGYRNPLQRILMLLAARELARR